MATCRVAERYSHAQRKFSQGVCGQGLSAGRHFITQQLWGLVADQVTQELRNVICRSTCYPHQLKIPIYCLKSSRDFLIWNEQQTGRYPHLYRVSQEEWTKLQEGVPYVKLYRYNPKHLCPKLNGYWDNGQIKLWTSFGSTNDSCQLVNFIYTARGFGANSADPRLKCISLHMSGRQAGSQQAGWRHRSAFQCDV